jgi:isopentenyl phosphate kinase
MRRGYSRPIDLVGATLVAILICFVKGWQQKHQVNAQTNVVEEEETSPRPLDVDVVVVKIGGSSITDKASFEKLRPDVLNWFARTLAASIGNEFMDPEAPSSVVSCALDDEDHLEKRQSAACSNITDSSIETAAQPSSQRAFIIVHGAGSFGHFQAKQYGLKGQSTPPTIDTTKNNNTSANILTINDTGRWRYQNRGLASTRLSVQKLNRLVVETLLDNGINAVGISPCINIPGVEAHVTFQPEPISMLKQVVRRTIQAGLVPVLHGDACLYGNDQVGILSGDTLVEVLGNSSWVSRAVFLTDVDGVFTDDPRTNPNVTLLREIAVDPMTKDLVLESDQQTVKASGSSHGHDVTGGLKVCIVFDILLLRSICLCAFVRPFQKNQNVCLE